MDWQGIGDLAAVVTVSAVAAIKVGQAAADRRTGTGRIDS